MPKLVIQTIHCPLQVAARPCPSAHGLAEDVFRRRSPPLALALRRRLLPGGRLRTRGALAGRRVVAAALRAAATVGCVTRGRGRLGFGDGRTVLEWLESTKQPDHPEH